MIEEIKEELIKIKDKKYGKFANKLIPNINNVLGVRLPILREIAKEIAKGDVEKYIIENNNEFMELTMLEGMAIGYLNCDYDKKLKLIDDFVKKIDNWSVCDSFCTTLKFINNHKKEFKNFLKPYFNSKKEYDLRFAFVILLSYYIDDYDFVLNKILKFKSDLYYAKMAAAWALSFLIIKNYDKAIKDLKTKSFQDFVYKKGITKAIESFKLNKYQKEELKTLRNLKKSHLSV